MGCPQEQAQDELREVVPRPALLLRQKHYPQDRGQAVCVQICVRLAEPFGL